MRLNAKFLLSELRALVPVAVELSKINRTRRLMGVRQRVPPFPESPTGLLPLYFGTEVRSTLGHGGSARKYFATEVLNLLVASDICSQIER